jgi:WD40 repeat protein
VIKGHGLSVDSVAFSPDGTVLATGGRDGWARLWNLAAIPERVIAPGAGALWSVSFSPDGQLLCIKGSLWDIATGRQRIESKWPPGPFAGVTFSPDGRLLARWGFENALRILDTTSGRDTVSLNSPVRLQLCAFSPDGKVIAAAGDDGTITVLDTVAAIERIVLKHPEEGVFSLSFSPDSKTIATGGFQSVALWDVATGNKLTSIKGALAATFSSDGKMLACGSDDGKVTLWDVETTSEPSELASLVGHASAIHSIVFLQDGKRLATASSDSTVKLWDIRTGQEVMSLKGHRAKVTSLALSPDGQTLASASVDGTVRLWQAASEEEVLAWRRGSASHSLRK